MADDDLSAPLGQGQTTRRRFVIPRMIPRTIAVALALCVGVFALWALLVDDPFGGEPVVVVTAEQRKPAAPGKKAEPPGTPAAAAKPSADPAAAPPAAAPEAPEKPAASSPPPGKTVTIIDGMSGKRQEVTLGEPDKARNAGADQRLVDTSRHGIIPKIGNDGARPSEVYARPPAAKPTAGRTEGPRIAIVVGGLGISASGTTEALAKLPGPVTLAFAPYGTDIERWVSRARSEGHEVLLQVPMEPFDYPDNDPGPQTLLSSLAAERNIDRLHWFMSRFQGYVGIANYMGARFTASEQAVAPVLRDAAKRGLIYFDDGSSPRSVAPQIAGANNLAFAKADLLLDAVATPVEIDAALARLEGMARERGIAVGVASALPVSIDRISQWAKAAEGRGIGILPISVVANKPKPS